MSNRNPDLAENPQGPVVPASISNKGGMAPQATSTIGTPTPPPQNITATGNASATTVLNPFGPRNELLQGGIVMDLPAICYSQFIQIPNQLEVTDDTVPWTIIAQLPYDPTSEYMNSYCRAYALQHRRYNGDIIYQVEVIGNATYSGTLAIGWVPQKLNETIASPEQLQKYSYKTMSVTLPSVEQFVLKDARQFEYYRTHEADISKRPHLVIAVHTSVVSPLRTGITVRIRLASRFASVTDSALYGAQPFFLSDPIAAPLGPSPSSSIFDGRAMEDIFPHMRMVDYDFRMCTDGITTLTIPFQGNTFQPWNLHTTASGLIAKSNLPNLTGYVTRMKDADTFFFVYSNSSEGAINNLFYGTSFADLTLSDLTSNLKGLVIKDKQVVRALFVETAVSDFTIKAQIEILTPHCHAVAWVATSTDSGKDYITLPFGDTDYYYPHNQVAGVVQYSSVTGLPLNWRNVVITSEPVTSLQTTDVAPSMFNDPIIESVLREEADKVGVDSILQFDLEDPESRQRVATLRWSTERRALVCATTDLARYSLYPSSINNLIVGNWSGVPKASGFPNTQLSQWASRVTQSSTQLGIRPNAAVAAELAEAGGLLESTEAEAVSLTGEQDFW